MKELAQFPMVRRASGELAYGGSQKWFPTKWRQTAGCASITAANLAAWYQIGVRPDDKEHNCYTSQHFLTLMNTMFGYMKPGVMGFSQADKFQQRFEEYADRWGSPLSSQMLEGWESDRTARDFVEQSIDGGKPLAMLILRHQAKEIDENTWHWMTVTGYDEKTGRILISNYGRREWMAADVVFAPGEKNEVKLIRFDPQTAEGRQAI